MNRHASALLDYGIDRRRQRAHMVPMPMCNGDALDFT